MPLCSSLASDNGTAAFGYRSIACEADTLERAELAVADIQYSARRIPLRIGRLIPREERNDKVGNT
jgi:hypothetical protein